MIPPNIMYCSQYLLKLMLYPFLNYLKKGSFPKMHLHV